MKKILPALILLLIGVIKGNAFTPPYPLTPNAEEFKKIAEMILDSSLQCGVFESPKPMDRIRTLKNGIIPETQEGYLENAITNSLIKFNTVMTLRGDFDSMVFSQTPAFDMDAEETIQFMPYPGTTWLVFFKTPFDNQGNASKAWIADMVGNNKNAYLNSKTFYLIANSYHGNVCMNWNKDYGTDETIPVATQQFREDLKIIFNTLKNLPADKNATGYGSSLNSMINAMKDAYGKGVATAIRGILLETKTPLQQEPDPVNKDQ